MRLENLIYGSLKNFHWFLSCTTYEVVKHDLAWNTVVKLVVKRNCLHFCVHLIGFNVLTKCFMLYAEIV
jgi:hypothetical protein